MSEKKHLSPYDSRDIALGKLQKYCAYQERSHQEVRKKLIQLEIYGDDLEDIITELIKDDYLNEERFARSYVRGKFRMKKWGRIKILQELKRRQISDYCIRKGMSEIEEEDYIETLTELINKETRRHDNLNDYQKRVKLYSFGLRKGYESEVVTTVLTKILAQN